MEKKQGTSGFFKRTTDKIGKLSSHVSDFVENPEAILRKFWKRYEKWFYVIGGYVGIFLLLRWMGKTNGLAWLLALGMLLASPLFFFWIITRFIPEIKMGSKVVFSRSQLNLKKQLKFGLRGLGIVAKEIYRAYPTFSLIVLLLFLLFIGITL